MQPDSGWTVAEAVADRSWVVELRQEHLQELERATSAQVDGGYDPNRDHPPEVALRGWGPVVGTITRALDGRLGFVLIRGLPIRPGDPTWSAVMLRVLGAAVGVVLPQNGAGERVGHVRDSGESTSRPDVRAYRTSEDISFHTDGADLVALLCLSSAAEGGESALASSAAVVAAMRREAPDLVEELEAPLAFDLFDERAADATEGFCLSPVIGTAEGRTLVQYGRRYLELAARHADAPALSRNARAAMDLLESTANRPGVRYDMALKPGDLQIINNYRVLHGRSAFRDDPGTGQVRHLLRLWMRAFASPSLPDGFGAAGGREGIVGRS